MCTEKAFQKQATIKTPSCKGVFTDVVVHQMYINASFAINTQTLLLLYIYISTKAHG